MDQINIKCKIYASEIDKYANIVSDTLFPNTENLGDVRIVRDAICGDNKYNLPGTEKVKQILKNVDFDLLVAGSPCQGFSFAGKQLNFDDERSKLFFDFLDIFNFLIKKSPNLKFILENVRMNKKIEEKISSLLGITPLRFNSNLVSAQNRYRLYWTNIGPTFQEKMFAPVSNMMKPPKDEKVFLKDILEYDVNPKYFLSKKALDFITNPTRIKKKYTAINGQKALCLTAKGQMNWTGTFIKCGRQVGRKLIDGKRADKSDVKAKQQIELRKDDKTNCLTTVQKDNLVILQRSHGFNKGGVFSEKSPTITSSSWQNNNHVIQLNPSKESGGKQPYQHNRVYDVSDKSPCLDTDGRKNILDQYIIRRLTPRECCRLQTIPNWAIEKILNCGVSDSQIYKMIGNGWTVKIISHILSFHYKHEHKTST